MAKALLVEDKGIGEDLPTTLVGWEADRFVCLTQATDRIMRQSRDKRIESLHRVAKHIHDGWYADAFTFISEGYCSVREHHDERPLEIAFINNPNVYECLTFLHVTPTGTLAVAAPYEQKLGRVVEFLPISKANSRNFTDQSQPLKQILNTDLIEFKSLTQHLNQQTRNIEQEGWEIVHDIWNDDYDPDD